MVTADRPATQGADSSPTTVFVHGFLDDGAVWTRLTAELAHTSPTPVVVDLAGMAGASTVAGPYTLERHAADVSARLADVPGPVVLVGQSTGAQIAELAAASSDRVVGLVLVTPVPLTGAGLPEEAVASFKALGGQPEAQRQLRQQMAAAFPAAELDRLVEVGAQIDPVAVPQFVDAWNHGVPAGRAPSTFTGPVLVLRGAADPFCTAEVVEAGVAPRFTHVTVASIPDAGHWAHVEQPRVVAHHLDAFLTSLSTPSPAGNTAAGVSSQGWTQAFEKKSTTAFGQAFAPEVRLQATVLTLPVVGVEDVQRAMACASGIYESLVFTQQAVQGTRTYLEWEATAFGGMQLLGVTVLVKDDQDRIVDIAIHHRPLAAALAFSRELAERMDGVLGRDLFYAG